MFQVQLPPAVAGPPRHPMPASLYPLVCLPSQLRRPGHAPGGLAHAKPHRGAPDRGKARRCAVDGLQSCSGGVHVRTMQRRHSFDAPDLRWHFAMRPCWHAVRTASAVERKRALARCPRGQVIGAVPSVFYGKHSARCSASSSYRCAMMRRTLQRLAGTSGNAMGWSRHRCRPPLPRWVGCFWSPARVMRALLLPLPRRVVAASCMGKALCSPLATDAAFGGDPCPRVKPKVLWFQYRCAGGAGHRLVGQPDSCVGQAAVLGSLPAVPGPAYKPSKTSLPLPARLSACPGASHKASTTVSTGQYTRAACTANSSTSALVVGRIPCFFHTPAHAAHVAQLRSQAPSTLLGLQRASGAWALPRARGPRCAARRARSSPPSREPFTARSPAAAAPATLTGAGRQARHLAGTLCRVHMTALVMRGSRAAQQAKALHTAVHHASKVPTACADIPGCCTAPCRLVARRCLGRRTCWVRASNIQFGVNPCPAIKPKYLFFQYKWAPAWARGGEPGDSAGGLPAEASRGLDPPEGRASQSTAPPVRAELVVSTRGHDPHSTRLPCLQVREEGPCTPATAHRCAYRGSAGAACNAITPASPLCLAAMPQRKLLEPQSILRTLGAPQAPLRWRRRESAPWPRAPPARSSSPSLTPHMASSRQAVRPAPATGACRAAIVRNPLCPAECRRARDCWAALLAVGACIAIVPSSAAAP